MSEQDYSASEMEPADAAFVQSDAHEVDGLALEPFTPAREVAAQAMGLKYPNLLAEDEEPFNATGVYPGALMDIAIVLFLCSQRDDPPDEKAKRKGTWQSAKDKLRRALSRPLEARETAIEWAAEQRFTDRGKDGKFWPAYNAMVKIIAERHKVASIPTGAGSGPPDPK